MDSHGDDFHPNPDAHAHQQHYPGGQLIDVADPGHDDHPSSVDSEDSSNGFVKLEHPRDLLADYGNLSNTEHETPRDEISSFGQHMEPEHHDHFDDDGRKSPPQEDAQHFDELNYGRGHDQDHHAPPAALDEFDPYHSEPKHEDLDFHHEQEHRDHHEHHERPTFEEPEPEELEHKGLQSENSIQRSVAGTHNLVDDVIQQMQESHDPPQLSPSADSERDTVGKLYDEDSPRESPHHARGLSPDEATFERTGPLTIPKHEDDDFEQPDKELLEEVHHHHFEHVPRPPTPPKLTSEEEFKPPVLDLGPPPSSHSHRQDSIPSSHPETPKKSILKNSTNSCGCAWLNLKNWNPCVLELIYWRDQKKSAVVLALTLLFLIVFAKFSLITVLSYTGLAVLGGTLGYRIFKLVESQIKKTEGGNPFKPYLDQDLSIPQDKIHQQVDVLVEHGQLLASNLRRLFLVEDILDTVKFGLLLWAFTYIGSWFSGLTLIILTVLGIFSIPKIYEVYQEPIDAQLETINGHITKVTDVIHEKLPFLKKHEKTQ